MLQWRLFYTHQLSGISESTEPHQGSAPHTIKVLAEHITRIISESPYLAILPVQRDFTTFCPTPYDSYILLHIGLPLLVVHHVRIIS